MQKTMSLWCENKPIHQIVWPRIKGIKGLNVVDLGRFLFLSIKGSFTHVTAHATISTLCRGQVVSVLGTKHYGIAITPVAKGPGFKCRQRPRVSGYAEFLLS